MKNNKIIISIVVALTIIISICIICFVIIPNNIIENIKVEDIKYDIRIDRIEPIDMSDLYKPISINDYRLINLSEKKLYIIMDRIDRDKNNEHTVKVSKIINLSESQMENVMLLYDGIGNVSTKRDVSHYTYEIEINGERKVLNNLPFEDDLW